MFTNRMIHYKPDANLMSEHSLSDREEQVRKGGLPPLSLLDPNLSKAGVNRPS